MLEKTLSQHVEEMRRLSETLTAKTYPTVTFEEDAKILPLKYRRIIVDGYEIAVNFSIANHSKFVVESLQIQAVYTPYLPFHLVCKLGRAFMGSTNLSYVDFMKQNKKIYYWTVKRKKGRSIRANKDGLVGSFEGFEYAIIKPGSVTLYES